MRNTAIRLTSETDLYQRTSQANIFALGDITGDVWSAVFTDKFRSGEGPVYMDCSTTSPEDYEYMMWP